VTEGALTMTDTETAPDFTPIKRPRRVPIAAPLEVPEQPAEPTEPPTETGAAPVADTAASVAPADQVASEPAPAAETPATPTRRGKRGPLGAAITVPWESALPGVRSSEIRAELARREGRAAELLAERERIVANLDAIEAALDAMGE
jgi:hypothetical protein